MNGVKRLQVFCGVLKMYGVTNCPTTPSPSPAPSPQARVTSIGDGRRALCWGCLGERGTVTWVGMGCVCCGFVWVCVGERFLRSWWVR